MPEHPRTMTENERLATLEANVVPLTKLADKWDKMLEKVTEIGTNVSNFSTQFATYQKNCETERTAHAQRLHAVEQVVVSVGELAKIVADHAPRIKTLEDRVLRGNTIWWVIVKVALTVGGLAGFAASIVAVLAVWHH